MIDLFKLTSAFNLNKYCVEFGASTGGTTSPTSSLISNGWDGLWIENDIEKFIILLRNYGSEVNLLMERVTPFNIVNFLNNEEVPKKFGCLVIDIDGYDYFVLEALLKKYRPSIIVAEINEKIPAPMKFSVLYSDEWTWEGDHFYGMSICKLNELCIGFNYSMIATENENVVIVDREINKYRSFSPEELYEQYKKSDLARSKTSYNFNVSQWLDATPECAMKMIKQHFKGKEDQYQIYI